MNLAMSLCQQTSNVLDIPGGRLKRDILGPRWQKDKVVVLMGATGTGKTRLSIDIATQFPSEIINSDKMQAYRGLDIVTNKITKKEMCGIPHHLLGIANPNSEFTATDFCDMTSVAVESILTRGLLPIIVGGSNSYVEALMDGGKYRFRSKYDCCFLWVDVSVPVLHEYVCKRVDQMVDNGMVEEVRNMFDPRADYSHGIRKSIGVPEFDRYFRAKPFLDEESRARLLQKAISDIKNNTCNLASRQLEKIQRLRHVKGWNIHRIDATEVFCRSGDEAGKAWDKLVSKPSSAIVGQFLYNFTDKFPATAASAKDYFAHCLVA